jgi:hypothetical protein
MDQSVPVGKPHIKFYVKPPSEPNGRYEQVGGIFDRGSQHIPTIEEPQLQFLNRHQTQEATTFDKMPKRNQQVFSKGYAKGEEIYKPNFFVTPDNLKELDRSSAQLQLQREYGRGDEEFAQKQQTRKQQKQPNSKSLLSHLKNPYVLGGLGVGALGLGGYAAYKAYQGSKKKKKPASE